MIPVISGPNADVLNIPSDSSIFFQVLERSFARNGLKTLVEVGKRAESAGVTNLGNTHFVLNQKFTSVSDAYFQQELLIGFCGSGFEIPVTRRRVDIDRPGYFLQGYFILEMIDGIGVVI